MRDDPTSDSKLFNLTVFEDQEGGAIEKFLNVPGDPGNPSHLSRVPEQGSTLVRGERSWPRHVGGTECVLGRSPRDF